MAIEFNSSIDIRSRTPLDLRIVVGADTNSFLFATKESIIHKYLGLTVLEADNNLREWRLVHLDPEQWVEIVTSVTIGEFEHFVYVVSPGDINHAEGETAFMIPANFIYDNTVVSINGIDITNDMHQSTSGIKMDNPTYVIDFIGSIWSINFNFELEPGDAVGIKALL